MVRQWIGPDEGDLYVIVISLETKSDGIGDYRRSVVGNYERCVKLTARIVRELIDSGYLRDGIRIEVYPNEKAHAYLAGQSVVWK